MTMMETDNNSLISIAADLRIAIGEWRDQKKKDDYWRRMAKKAAMPVEYTYSDQIICPASGFGVMRLTGPDQGHMWYVRRIVVGGLTPNTAAAGRADVWRSANDYRRQTAFAGSFTITDWKDQAVALPNIGTYSRGALVLRMNEELYVTISGATSGQQYVATCDVEDIEEAAVAQVFME